MCGGLAATAASAHGLVGKRFFPATLATDDPFVADELSLPTISTQDAGERRRARDARDGLSVDVSKRVTENLGIGFGATYKQCSRTAATRNAASTISPRASSTSSTRATSTRSILSAGVDWDIGSSGSKRVGAESFSTFTPALFFGKGFGDLSDGHEISASVRRDRASSASAFRSRSSTTHGQRRGRRRRRAPSAHAAMGLRASSTAFRTCSRSCRTSAAARRSTG